MAEAKAIAEKTIASLEQLPRWTGFGDGLEVSRGRRCIFRCTGDSSF